MPMLQAFSYDTRTYIQHLKLPLKLTTHTVIYSVHENNEQLFIQLHVLSILIPNVPGTVKFSCVTLLFRWWMAS